ncbi:MAG: FAD-dependent oxidoreductase [Armatimonadota bacterium]
MKSSYDVLIIGNSTAAIGAVEAIRGKDSEKTICLVANESEHTYSRPLITYFMAGKVEESNIYYRPLDFYQKMNVDTLLGTSVTSIDTDNNFVSFDNGDSISYGSLIIAAGGSPIQLRCEGTNLDGVFYMNTIEDARNAKEWLKTHKKAVVIGAGLTGLKTAEALSVLGIDTTVIELADRILAMNTDDEGAALVEKVLRDNNIKVLTKVSVTALEPDSSGKSVGAAVLSNKEKVECDTVFVTIGVRPRIDLVENSGIETNRGILVDKHMKTNIPNVYAAGDIAEAFDPIYQDRRVLPILPNAYIGGRIAGLNILGIESEYNVGMSVNSVSFFGYPTMSAGFGTQPEGDGFNVKTISYDNVYKRFVTKDGKLVGMILCGDVEKAGIITGIMRSGIDISGMEDMLLEGDLKLINLPESLIEERIHTAGRNWM